MPAQTTAKKTNLVVNGDFETGLKGFASEYAYSKNFLTPGYFSVARFASSLNKDYRNPIEGDHTSGYGYYFIVDSDGTSGKKAWYTTVNVIPNSNYNFSIYFCNLYKHRGSDFGFQINGLDIAGGHPKLNDCKVKFTVANEQAGETEVDIYHLFHWVKGSAIWYSGTHSGKVEISIENINYNASGNDMAMDDIEFTYIETMPKGYKPPEKKTIMVAGNRVYTEEKFRIKKNNEPEDVNGIYAGDSIAPGIYSLYSSKKRTHDTLAALKPEKIKLENVIFEQASAMLDSAALKQLDKLALWMKKNPSVSIRLEGHTDNVGKPTLNQTLSEDRVNSVKDYLVGLGIKDTRIQTKAYGGSYPIVYSTDEEARKFNRRVEIEVIE
ncbi:MAG TPA: OmpA family protein [Cytophagaceae bacterium]|nr:OmpA family protein [Cytophagaceae bacterium]